MYAFLLPRATERATGRSGRVELQTGFKVRQRRGRWRKLLLGTFVAGSLAFPADEAPAQTLDGVFDRGLLQCGLTVGGEGLAEIDERGRWIGFFPDMCRALAAAILGDAEAIEIIEVDFVTRFTALRDGAFDVLMANTTWSMSRDIALELAFTSPLLYDGQGLLAHHSLGIGRLSDLEGRSASVCVHSNTTTIGNLQDLVARDYPNLEIRAYESNEAGYDAFFARGCDLFTTDRSSLIGLRASRAANPADYVLLADFLSREPLAPAVRQDDIAWVDVVQWVMFALIIAEEYQVTAENLDSPDHDDRPEVARLLGREGEFGAQLGLPSDWAYQAVRQVGNYGQVFERNLGTGSALGMARGLNELWTNGGLIYAPPLR